MEWYIYEKLHELHLKLFNLESYNESASALFQVDIDGYIISFIHFWFKDYLTKKEMDMVWNDYTIGLVDYKYVSKLMLGKLFDIQRLKPEELNNKPYHST